VAPRETYHPYVSRLGAFRLAAAAELAGVDQGENLELADHPAGFIA
jgi:hypothetical protein